MDSTEKRWFDAIDGNRTIGNIVEEILPSSQKNPSLKRCVLSLSSCGGTTKLCLMLQVLKVNNVVASGQEQERPRNITNEIRKDKFQTTGDIHMLKYAKGHKGVTLSLLVHHDDAEREVAYDGGTEKALQLATKEGWIVVSMKNDWKTVFHI